MEKEYVYSSVKNGVGVVEFFHPSANSMPLELLDRLSKEIDECSDNEEVKIILIKSGGDKTFCAGASFTDLSNVKTLEEGVRFFSGFAKVLNSIRNSKKLVFGRSQGKAVGGGVGILAACDYVFATEASSIKLSELSVGIGPFVIAPAVERKIGISGLCALTLEPEQWKTAYWAKEKGLYNVVFENIEDMDKDIDLYLSKIVSYKDEAKYEIKKLISDRGNDWGKLLYENAKISARLWVNNIENK